MMKIAKFQQSSFLYFPAFKNDPESRWPLSYHISLSSKCHSKIFLCALKIFYIIKTLSLSIANGITRFNFLAKIIIHKPSKFSLQFLTVKKDSKCNQNSLFKAQKISSLINPSKFIFFKIHYFIPIILAFFVTDVLT